MPVSVGVDFRGNHEYCFIGISLFFYFQNINTNSYWFVVNVITVTIEELEEKWSLFKENDICPSFREASVT